MSTMTKGEIENLQRLIRQRERVLKSAAKQRSSELLADFKNQMGQQYAFDDDEVWMAAAQEAQKHVERAESVIAARCHELGIPKRFAPAIRLNWIHRGYDNALDRRRKELLGMATSQIEAQERKAFTEIEASCLEAQMQLAVAGISSDAARAFIEKLPSVTSLMPALSFEEIAGESDPPIAEKLVSSNAMRQRRFRERQAALKAAQAPSIAQESAQRESGVES